VRVGGSMSSVCGRPFAIALTAAVVALAGCEREQRDFHTAKAGPNHYQRDAYDVAQGKRLFTWMNCTGCHSHGGGGMGPALTDRVWFYGSSLKDIHDTIRDGRPNGMPAWRSRLTDQQIWQLAAYVRSMGRYVRKDVAPSRDDSMQSSRAESRRAKATPVQGSPP
jgi:cytochrome c oxidase cbb3-type subunit 3